MSWNTVKGHDAQINALRAAIGQNRLHHSLLFTGPSGVGKKMVAYRVAAAALCKTAGSGDLCGTCSTCRRILAGTHPDVVLVEREPDKRFIVIGDDSEVSEKAKTTAVHSVRRMTEIAYRKPLEADRKFFIIDECERMNHEAQSAFLKTLEEPPANTHFILVCTNSQSMHETVLSRCLMLRFHPLSSDAVREIFLVSVGQQFTHESELASAFSEGSPGSAITYFKEELLDEIVWLLEFLKGLKTENPFDLSDALLSRATEGVGKKRGGEENTKTGLEPIRERIIFFLRLIQQAFRPFGNGMITKLSPEWITECAPETRAICVETALEAVRDIMANVRPQLVLDNFIVRITRNVGR